MMIMWIVMKTMMWMMRVEYDENTDSDDDDREEGIDNDADEDADEVIMMCTV